MRNFLKRGYHQYILEDHILPFVRKWQVFPGFYGEQGVEFVHATCNRYNGKSVND